MALSLKSCPRCRGDMKSNRDMYGEFKMCLQCGHMVDLPKPPGLFALSFGDEPPAPKRKAA